MNQLMLRANHFGLCSLIQTMVNLLYLSAVWKLIRFEIKLIYPLAPHTKH